MSVVNEAALYIGYNIYKTLCDDTRGCELSYAIYSAIEHVACMGSYQPVAISTSTYIYISITADDPNQ